MEKKEIKKELEQTKDLEVFANSEGGERLLKEAKNNILASVSRLIDVSAVDKDAMLDIAVEIKANLKVYYLLTDVKEEIAGLKDALDLHGEED